MYPQCTRVPQYGLCSGVAGVMQLERYVLHLAFGDLMFSYQKSQQNGAHTSTDTPRSICPFLNTLYCRMLLCAVTCFYCPSAQGTLPGKCSSRGAHQSMEPFIWWVRPAGP